GGGGGSSVRSSSSPARDNPALVRGNGGGSSSNSNSTPQSLPRGHGHLGSVSAVSPAHTHHSARPSAPSPSALKLAAVASRLELPPWGASSAGLNVAAGRKSPGLQQALEPPRVRAQVPPPHAAAPHTHQA